MEEIHLILGSSEVAAPNFLYTICEHHAPELSDPAVAPSFVIISRERRIWIRFCGCFSLILVSPLRLASFRTRLITIN